MECILTTEFNNDRKKLLYYVGDHLIMYQLYHKNGSLALFRLRLANGLEYEETHTLDGILDYKSYYDRHTHLFVGLEYRDYGETEFKYYL